MRRQARLLSILFALLLVAQATQVRADDHDEKTEARPASVNPDTDVTTQGSVTVGGKQI